MSAIVFERVTRRYPRTTALDGFDLAVEPRSFTVLCGPPRSGKSVLFRLAVGLEAPDDGRILMDGTDITRLRPAARRIGYVPQSFALYPHMSVRDNIAYPLTLARAPREEIARRVDRAAAILSIGHLLAKTPDQLSGGEKQRTAVARGLLNDASLFVLDDPLVGLDYKLRERLMEDLKTLQKDRGATFLYATSDSLEALTMARTLVVMDAGRVVQAGAVTDVYDEPTDVRTLSLVGFPQANLVAGALAGGVVTAGPFGFALDADAPDQPVTVGLRPEALRLGAPGGVPGGGPGLVTGRAQVRLVEDLGGERVAYLDQDGCALTAAFASDDGPPPAEGESVAWAVDPRAALVFAGADGRRLGRGRG
jgi:ABC-type sugar transport system ATPase subunit